MPNNCEGFAIISNIPTNKHDRLVKEITEGNVAEWLIPYPKEVREDLKMEHKYAHRYNQKTGKRVNRDWRQDGYTECPYKQLWYHWQIDNWGQKWGICEPYIITNNPTEISLNFWTARGPTLPIFETMSKKLKCDVYYEWQEPGMNFSGRAKYKDGELIDIERYDDYLFGEGVECENCGCLYETDSDSWYDKEHSICESCATEIMSQYNTEEMLNKLMGLQRECKQTHNKEFAKTQMIDKIHSTFSVNKSVAEFIYDYYFNNNQQ